MFSVTLTDGVLNSDCEQLPVRWKARCLVQKSVRLMREKLPVGADEYLMTVRLLSASDLALGTTKKGKEARACPLQLLETNSMLRERNDGVQWTMLIWVGSSETIFHEE